MPKFRTAYNFVLNETCTTCIDQPSMTVPDESYTVQELYERYSSGILPNVSKTPIYELDENSSNFFEVDPLDDPAIDLSDVDDLLNTYRSRTSPVRNSEVNDVSDPSKDAKRSEASAAGDETAV